MTLKTLIFLLVLFVHVDTVYSAVYQSNNGFVDENIVKPLFNMIGIDKEAMMTTPELIANEGYPVETYTVRTEDGHLLELFRIPHGLSKERNRGRVKRPPIMILHPHSLSSGVWVFNKKSSPAFVLADAGFDVWLPNLRGTVYSTHESISRSSAEYYDFTYDDIGKKDIPSLIDAVLSYSGSKDTYVMAHVYGAYGPLITLSTLPEYNKKVKLFVGLGAHTGLFSDGDDPVTRLDDRGRLPGPGVFMFNLPFYQEICGIISLFIRGHLPLDNPIVKAMVQLGTYADVKSGLGFLNKNILVMHAKYDSGCINQTRLPVYARHFPAALSVNAFLHVVQIITTKLFRPKDFGRAENIKRYGKEMPDLYPLDKITAPVLFTGHDNDFGYNTRSVKYLQSQLTSSETSYFHVREKGWCHLDYVFQSKGKEMFYNDLIELLYKFENKSKSRFY